MSRSPLTDAQLTAALQRVVPGGAPAGLHRRIIADASGTRQRHSLPSPLAVLIDVDPLARRRALLLAAALLASLALVGTAVVGSALLERSRNPLLEQTRVVNPTPGPSRGATFGTPAEVAELVGSAYLRMPALQPMTVNAVEGDEAIRIYVDATGAVRIERRSVGSADPDTYEILSGTRMGQLVAGPDGPAWYEQTGAISEDPRVFVFGALGQAGVTIENSQRCQTTTSTGEQLSPELATAWTYLGVERVAGRDAYHVECGGRNLWLDADTRITLRSSGPVVDEAWNVIPGQTGTVEVTSIDVGQPPAELFAIRAPDGVPVLDEEAYSCVTDPTCLASPRPIETAPPARQAPEPAPLKALIAAAEGAAADPPAFQATIVGTNTKLPSSLSRVFADGTGRYRIEDTYNVGRGDEGWAVTIAGIDRPVRTEGQGDGPTVWTDACSSRIPATECRYTTRGGGTPWQLRLPEGCEAGWSHVGVDMVLNRPADHVRCESETAEPDYWIDRDTHLVVRRQDATDERYGTWVYEVIELEFQPQPEALFALPPGAVVQP